MIHHLSSGSEVRIVTASATQYTALIIDTNVSQKTLHINAPIKDGEPINLPQYSGRQFLVVFEAQQDGLSVVVSYPADIKQIQMSDTGRSYEIRLLSSPKIIKKRHNSRTNTRLDLVYRTSTEMDAELFSGETINLSTGGMKFESPKRLHLNSTIYLYLYLPSAVILLEGSILEGKTLFDALNSPSSYIYRLQFADSYEFSKKAIEQYLESLE